jgi:arabinose-5-phosphate isomerase
MMQQSISDEIVRVLKIETQALARCAERFDQPIQRENLSTVLKLMKEKLESGGKIVVSGVGKSGKIGQKIAATLCSTGSLSVFLHPTEGLHGDLGMVQNQDVILALSNTGNTDELVQLLPSLKKAGVKIIAICGNQHSKLVEFSDHWIDASVEQEACPHNLAPTTSTTLTLAIGDALAVALMQMRGFDSKSFAKLHPGGSLGRRLYLKVADVMHTEKQVATVPAQASMDTVVMASTEKKLGAVLVIDGHDLLGIITDGDLRRALQHKEKFFKLAAMDVMTKKPITIREDQMAQEALDLMENRSSQIGVLPVVDAQGKWKGLIRLHDLVRTL